MKKYNIDDWSIYHYQKIGSTNDYAKTHALNSNEEKFGVVSDVQISGKGRRGRDWSSPEGNLYSSLAFSLDYMDLNNIGEIAFVVSLAVRDAILDLAPELKDNLKLKWPNDVLINDKKISGILLEKTDDYLVVGVGINIIELPDINNILYQATSLKNEKCDIDRDRFLEVYVRKFDYWLEQRKNNSFELIRDNWIKSAKGLNTIIKVNYPTSSISGKFVGLDENGGLLLETDSEIKTIYAGDVFFEE
jgi:BirA family biotin operon repressor/biotin-[acetyl-CoA-carboxylase] ligase